MRARLQLRALSSAPGLFLATVGATTLAWVAQLTWHDVAVWGKDLVLIFFGSRTGENISLGIGMKIIHYFLVGLTLLFLGSLTLLRTQNKMDPRRAADSHINHSTKKLETKKGLSSCFHRFGYLRSLRDFESVPEECLTCQKMLECRNVRPKERQSEK